MQDETLMGLPVLDPPERRYQLVKKVNIIEGLGEGVYKNFDELTQAIKTICQNGLGIKDLSDHHVLFRVDYEWEYTAFYVMLFKPETDEEFYRRHGRAMAYKEEKEKRKLEKERKEYERLKKKFEGSHK